MRMTALMSTTAAIALAALTLPAHAAISITDASISGGRLVVSGNAGAGGVRVTLDGGYDIVSGPLGRHLLGRLPSPGLHRHDQCLHEWGG